MILQVKKEFPRNNLSENDEAAIYYFTKREDIVITKADEGGATVIMGVEEYIRKSNQQLKDEKFYKKLNEDPTRKDSDTINNTIESFKKQEPLSTSTAKIFTTKNVRTQQFHIAIPSCGGSHKITVCLSIRLSVNSAFFSGMGHQFFF